MDFEPTEDKKLQVESARRMVESDTQPMLDCNAPDLPLSKAEMLNIFEVFAREGLIAPHLPIGVGGSGMKMLDYGIIYEQLPPMVAPTRYPRS